MSEKYADRRGAPLTALEYSVLRKLNSYTNVAEHSVGEHRIRTTWNGVLASYGGLFTTYVHLGKSMSPFAYDMPTRDYNTERDALEGHARAVELVRAIHNNGNHLDVNRIHAALDGIPDEPFEVAKNATDRRRRGL